MNQRLQHDVAWATAQHIAEALRDLENQGKLDEAFIHVYARVKAGLEVFEIQPTRYERRMHPGRN